MDTFILSLLLKGNLFYAICMSVSLNPLCLTKTGKIWRRSVVTYCRPIRAGKFYFGQACQINVWTASENLVMLRSKLREISRKNEKGAKNLSPWQSRFHKSGYCGLIKTSSTMKASKNRCCNHAQT